MPSAARKPCSQPGCKSLQPCAQHVRKAWHSDTKPKRITGTRLQAMRARLFARDPLCAECRKHGRTALATVRDHVVALAEGGKDDYTNEQGLCVDCHGEKTSRESRRGRDL